MCQRLFFRYHRERVDPLQLTVGLCVGLGLVEAQVRRSSRVVTAGEAGNVGPFTLVKDGRAIPDDDAPAIPSEDTLATPGDCTQALATNGAPAIRIDDTSVVPDADASVRIPVPPERNKSMDKARIPGLPFYL